MIEEDGSRMGFNNFLTKNHVAHPLIHHENRHNDVPLLLSAVLALGGTPAQLSTAYNHRKEQLEPWPMSPRRVSSLEQALGDPRFQRAYMDYFSTENVRRGGNTRSMVLDYLFDSPKPLVHGLFGGFGQPLLVLAEAVELSSAILLVDSIVLAAIDWTDDFFALLTEAALMSQASSRPPLGPAAILARVATDARLSGTMRSAAGFHEVSRVLADSAARAALVEYVCLLGAAGNLPALLGQLTELSALLLCGAHKPGRPAFDFYLGQLCSFVRCLYVLLVQEQIESDGPGKLLVVRGVWLLFLLAYTTQLRPILDPSLISNYEIPDDSPDDDTLSWLGVFSEIHGRPDTLKGKYLDTQFVGAMRSLAELARWNPGRNKFLVQAACKLRDEWHGWSGSPTGPDSSHVGEGLNIRL